jgi:ornithine carbamoyltransferase
MGGSAIFLDHSDAKLGERESVRDVAKNLERWVHGIVARTYKNKSVVELAEHASIPVINGLTDLLHPCQALTDYFTILEKFGSFKD